MKLSLSMQLAWQRLRQNPLNTVLFLLSFFAVFFTYYALGNTMIIDNQSQTAHEAWRDTSPYDLYLVGFEIPDIADKVAALNSVQRIEALTRFPVYFRSTFTSVMAIEDEPGSMFRIELLQGAYPTNGEEILIASRLAGRYDLTIGDTITLVSAQTSEENGTDYRISGTMGDNLGVINALAAPLEGLQRLPDPYFGGPMPGIGIKAKDDVHLGVIIAELNELQRTGSGRGLYRYDGKRVQPDETGIVTTVTTTIRGLLLLASSFFVITFTTFTVRSYAKENGIMLAIGLDRPWLALINIVSFALISICAVLCLWLALPLLEILFGISFWSFKISFGVFLRDMLPIVLLTLAVAIIHNLTFMDTEAEAWLRDDWLD